MIENEKGFWVVIYLISYLVGRSGEMIVGRACRRRVQGEEFPQAVPIGRGDRGEKGRGGGLRLIKT